MGDTDDIRLRDGSRLVIRPICPVDAAALVALHARLSADTIYRRYFGARPHLSPGDVDRFTRIPERWRFALVAVRGPGDLVAVARYEGRPGATSAEIAVVVDDALHHQGVGRGLLGRLVDVARERGLEALVADVLSRNAPMLGLLRAIGLPARAEGGGDTRTVTLDLTGLDLPAERRSRARRHIVAAESGWVPGEGRHRDERLVN
ncbi:GNAT family N-acetyltransferase [Pseudonocardia sp. H11422]|uniref:GNAT family N-acetyltransferase n=1 Tax=Pseudonocardia sp. H11422 TaxID=2835866 RepID=UPI001BDBFB49|nr:GNAT family N-acetyltransferase [Pseudonocardia sp. H11422]